MTSCIDGVAPAKDSCIEPMGLLESVEVIHGIGCNVGVESSQRGQQ